MSAIPWTLVVSLAAVLGAIVLCVLPGAALADRLAGPRSAWSARLILAFTCSTLVVTGLAAVLIATGTFSGARLAHAAGGVALTGLPAVRRWWRGAPIRRPVTLAWAAVLVAPWVAFTGAAGWRPADTLQWYYAGLGTDLTRAGGLPSGVAEWGERVRWLPDYLVFDVHAEAHRALLAFAGPTAALAAWRVPVALAGIVLVFLVLRLWFGRAVAIAGTVVISGTVFFLAKFDAYKPEAAGIVLGLAALWLVVRGLRSGRRSWVLLGGAALGLCLSVHAIAATVMGLLVAGFGVAEWLMLRSDLECRRGRRGRRDRLDWLVRAAALGLVLSLTMGIGLQGRAAAAGGALNPGAGVTPGSDPSTGGAGADPTWTFFLRSTGRFDEPEPPPPARPLAGGVTSPWAGFRINSAFGWWLIPVAAIGALGTLAIGGRRGRGMVVGLGVSVGLVGLGIAFFTLGFDTYVPRWTGLVRFGQYVPLLAALGVTAALAGYLRAWSWLASVRVPRRLALLAVVLGVVWLLPIAGQRYRAETGLSVDGLAALEELRMRGQSDDVVVSNALTTGSIEWFTGLEAPFEGRQPLIEELATLARTNQLLLDGHRWFQDPLDRSFLDGLGVSWVLAVDLPVTLAAPAGLGGSVAWVATSPHLQQVWSGEGIALFQVRAPVLEAAVSDDLRPLVDPGRTALSAAVGGLVMVGLVGARRRRSSPALH